MQRGGVEAGGGVQHEGETARDGEDSQDEEGEGGGVCVRTKHALISNRIVALMTEAASSWFEGSLSLRMRLDQPYRESGLGFRLVRFEGSLSLRIGLDQLYRESGLGSRLVRFEGSFSLRIGLDQP